MLHSTARSGNNGLPSLLTISVTDYPVAPADATLSARENQDEMIMARSPGYRTQGMEPATDRIIFIWRLPDMEAAGVPLLRD
jgi:hypothetical protein